MYMGYPRSCSQTIRRLLGGRKNKKGVRKEEVRKGRILRRRKPNNPANEEAARKITAKCREEAYEPIHRLTSPENYEPLYMERAITKHCLSRNFLRT